MGGGGGDLSTTAVTVNVENWELGLKERYCATSALVQEGDEESERTASRAI